VADKGFSVRETERLVGRELNPPAKKSNERKPDRDLLRLEDELSDRLGATVKISANRKGGGSLTIRFGSLDQLDGLLSRLD
jgi:ParB family chromosome partitioning protein